MNVAKTNRSGLRNLKVLGLLSITLALVLISSYVAVEHFRSQKIVDSNSSEDTLTQHANIDPKETSSPSSNLPSRKTYYAWSEADQTKIERHEELSAEAVYVNLNGEFDKWLIGSPVVVEVPQTQKLYRSVVSRMEIDDFGNHRIWAEPDLDENEFSQLIVTVSDNQILAYVSTEQGNYEMTGTADGGWLVPTQELQANIDPTKNDVIGTLRHRHANTKYVPKRSD